MDKLILDAKNGNEYAMEQILIEHKQLVNSVARKYFLIGGDVDDLIQEGMIAMYNAVLSYDVSKNSSFDAYAHMLIQRNIINKIKEANSKKNAPLNDAFNVNNQGTISFDGENEDIGYMISSQEPNPENKLITNDSYKELLEKIQNALSDYENKVLGYYLEGYNYNDIAAKLDAAPKSIDNALNRIKRKLNFLKVRSGM